MTWHDITWHNMTWHYMTWHDMTWHDMTSHPIPSALHTLEMRHSPTLISTTIIVTSIFLASLPPLFDWYSPIHIHRQSIVHLRFNTIFLNLTCFHAYCIISSHSITYRVNTIRTCPPSYEHLNNWITNWRIWHLDGMAECSVAELIIDRKKSNAVT
jgi:hypothetical protein